MAINSNLNPDPNLEPIPLLTLNPDPWVTGMWFTLTLNPDLKSLELEWQECDFLSR